MKQMAAIRVSIGHAMGLGKRRKPWAAVLLAGLAVAGLEAPGATHYVVVPGTAGVTPTAPFTTPETAGTNVLEVVNAAMAGAAPRIVRVGAGTYYPTNTITVGDGLRIESVDGPEATILDGTHAGGNRGIYFTMDTYRSDPSLKQQVVGLTIRNYVVVDQDGAGIMAFGARRFDVLLADCVFEGNRALAGPKALATYGGAVNLHLSRTVLADVKVNISNCVFRANEGRYAGGAVRVYATYGQIDIADSIFENNTNSIAGGALTFTMYSNNPRHRTTIARCRFSSNLSGHLGGGASFDNLTTNLVISNCVFENNHARYFASWAAARLGGGVYADAPGVTLENCRVTGNQANVGGGIYAPRATLVNCLVAGNSAVTNGGGVYLESGTILNSTIAGNTAGVAAAGLFINGGGAATNSIIYHNTAPAAANYLHAGGDTGLAYSCVTPPVSGPGNRDGDPKFQHAAAGNYRLSPNSPCLNTGLALPWMIGAIDLDGNKRVDAACGLVDMGCYERVYHGSLFSIR